MARAPTLQQWLQKLEYQGMQQKGLLFQQAALLTRMQSAATNGEKRQDSEQCQPPDFLRHWREAESKEERRYLACQAVSKHMEKGMCCLPGILVWLYQLRLERQLERQWQQRAAAEQAMLQALARAAASRPGGGSEHDGGYSREQYADWRGDQEVSQPEQSSQPGETAISNGSQ